MAHPGQSSMGRSTAISWLATGFASCRRSRMLFRGSNAAPTPCPCHQKSKSARSDRESEMEHLSYPNESTEYRTARNELLDEEMALRVQIEAVAAKRRALPLGGEVAQDYIFERIGKTSMPEKVKMSDLFGSYETLVLYSFMYGPERELQNLLLAAAT